MLYTYHAYQEALNWVFYTLHRVNPNSNSGCIVKPCSRRELNQCDAECWYCIGQAVALLASIDDFEKIKCRPITKRMRELELSSPAEKIANKIERKRAQLSTNGLARHKLSYFFQKYPSLAQQTQHGETDESFSVRKKRFLPHLNATVLYFSAKVRVIFKFIYIVRHTTPVSGDFVSSIITINNNNQFFVKLTFAYAVCSACCNGTENSDSECAS